MPQPTGAVTVRHTGGLPGLDPGSAVGPEPAAGENGMKKKDIAVHVAAEAGLTGQDARAAVNAVFGCIRAALLRGEAVQVAHFGTFLVSTRAAGSGRDFRTGTRVEIPPTRRAVFRAGSNLRSSLNADRG